MNDKMIYVDKLDSGFVIKTEGKSSAIQSTESLKGLLVKHIDEVILMLLKASVRDMLIKIVVDENLPKAV